MSDLISRSDAIALADGAGYLSIETLQSIPSRALIDATAERDALRALLTEARDDLEEYANADWPEPSRSQYPDIMRRWKRDMDLCWRIDAALQEDTPNDV